MTQTTKNAQKENSISNYTIENYIQRVSELSQSGHKIPTNEELENIATDLGISKEEIEVAYKQSQDHFVRAQGYIRLQYWDDAIDELQESVVFNPSNLEMLNLLANAHLGRWNCKHDPNDEQQIKLRIKQCLELKPDHEESLNLLAKLDQAITQYKKKRFVLGAVLTVFVGSIIGYLFLNDISFNLFSKRDVQLENLKLELTQELDELRQYQEENWTKLERYANEQNRKSQSNLNKIAKTDLELKRVQQQNRVLQQENQRLNQKTIQLEKQLQEITKLLYD